MGESVISVNGLTKRFGSAVAVDDLSFRVRSGSVTGFLGPNGAGKTTTIRMILGLVRPTSGETRLFGKPFEDLARPALRVGVLLDGAGAHPNRTGRNHLRVVSAERGIAEKRVDEVLRIVELHGEGRRRVGQYSLGMRQRLDLAAALLGEPELLILDEPANGLDPAGIHWLRDFLRAFAREGGTVFVSSHQLAELSQMADEVIVINRGRLVTHTRVAELTAGHAVRVRSPEAARLQLALESAGSTVQSTGDGVLEVTDLAIERVGEIAMDERVVLHELVSQVNTLEEVFLELTGGGEAK